MIYIKNNKKKILLEITLVMIFSYISIIGGNILIGNIFKTNINLIQISIFTLSSYWLELLFVLMIKNIFKDFNKEVRFTTKRLPMQILIGIILFIVYLIIYKLFGNESDGIKFVLNLDTILDFIVCFFGIAVVEEYVYRIFIYNKILELKNSKLLAVIVSSMLFGLCHFSYDLDWIISSIIFGILLSGARSKFKNCSFISLIIVHGMFDFLIKYLNI